MQGESVAGVGACAGKGVRALEDAFHMIVRALAHLHAAVGAVQAKMDARDRTVRSVQEVVRFLEQEFDAMDRGLAPPLHQLEETAEAGAQACLEAEGGTVEASTQVALDFGAPLEEYQARSEGRMVEEGLQVSLEEEEEEAEAEASPPRAAEGEGEGEGEERARRPRRVAKRRWAKGAGGAARLPWDSSPPGPAVALGAGADEGGRRSASLHALGGKAPPPPPLALLWGARPAHAHAHAHAPKATRSHPGAAACHSPARTPPPRAHRKQGAWLLRAAQDGRAKDVRVLLRAGADVDHRNRRHMTALHVAALRAHAHVVRLLLERGASANARTAYGLTALHMAAYNDPSGDCASLLIYAGCDLDSASHSGRTALHLAAECGNEAAVRALLAAGADKSARNDEGLTAFDMARSACVRRLLAPTPAPSPAPSPAPTPL